MKVNVLCIGDIVGRPGRRVVAEKLGQLVRDKDIHCVIANAENSAGGSGITPQIYQKLGKYGVHLITLGDHAYRKRDIIPILENSNNIIRPANMSPNAAGKDFAVHMTNQGLSVGVVTLLGRTFMKPAEDMFSTVDRVLLKLKGLADVIFVEVHAEATSEKIAMGYYLDGRVGCVFGTHTHVATADERVLPKGTAYITDIGMTGPHESVLGRGVENVIKSFRTQMPFPFDVATGDVRLNAILVTVDNNKKTAQSIERIRIDADFTESTNYDSDDGRPESFNSM